MRCVAGASEVSFPIATAIVGQDEHSSIVPTCESIKVILLLS